MHFIKYASFSLKILNSRVGILLSNRGDTFVKSCFVRNMSKYKVYVTRELPSDVMDILKKTCQVTSWPGSDPVPRNELLKNIKDMDALYCLLTDKIDKEVLDAAGSNLKLIATMSVGFDHLALDEIKNRGIKVSYTPDILTDATAELTVSLLLATSRRLSEGIDEVKNGGWKSWSPFWMCGHGLSGSVVGIVGFGRIGQQVARILKPFNVKKIIYHNRSEKNKEAREIGATKVSFDNLLKESDFVIVTCALTPQTDKIFNDDAFKKMKQTAVFINTSRGGLVDQEALIRALQNKVIWAAGLDVTTPEPLPTSSPLLKLNNCIVLPHIGSATLRTRHEMALLTAKNIIAHSKGEELLSELVL